MSQVGRSAERNERVSCRCSWHLLGSFGIEDPILRVRDHRPERVDRSGRGRKSRRDLRVCADVFAACDSPMLISMSEIDAVKWSDRGVNGLLPTGTVTLLWADIEGSTRLWETLPEEMTAAVENLDRTLADLVGVHRGVRPVEQGEGDSFVVAFTRA